jgi:hypothetical protein
MGKTLQVLASGGIMIVDDITPHQAFAIFARDFPQLETLICPHSDRAGSFFGLVHKPASSGAARPFLPSDSMCLDAPHGQLTRARNISKQSASFLM